MGGTRVTTTAFLAAALAHASAFGQTETSGTSNEPQIQPPISVTATRNPIDAFDYPGMVTVIGRDSIDSTQPSTPDDILRYVPGVDFLGGPRRTGEVPSIRGFDGPDVITLLDGARQNFISGHDGQFFVDPFFLRQIEVVKGSSSALYGSGGTGGVIELRTIEAGDFLAPGEKYGGQVVGGYQDVSEEWSTGLIAFSRPVQNFEILGGAVYRASDDIRLGNDRSLPSRDDIVSGLLKGRLRLGDGHRVEASWQRFSNDAKEPNNGQDGDAADLVDKEISTDNLRLAYGYRNPSNPWIDLDVLGYYVDSNVEETRLDNNGAGPAGQVEDRKLSTLGLRVDNRSRAKLGKDVFSVFTYGVEAYRDEGEGETDGASRAGVPDAKSYFIGVFAQGQFDLDNLFGSPVGVSVIPGLRYDYYESDSDSAGNNSSDEVSPKIAVQIRPVEPLTVFGSYARAFRAPNLNELFPTGTHFVIPGFGVNRFVANPGLKPQVTDTYEVGAGLRFRSVIQRNDLVQVKGAYYDIKGDDFIDTVVTQAAPPACFPPNCNGTTRSENVANAKLHGFEIEAVYDSRRLLFEAGFAHIDGEDEDTGAPLGVLTPDKLTLHAAVKIVEANARVGWRYTYADEFDNTRDPALVRDDYHLNDVYVSWRAGRTSPLRGLDVTVGVDNLFDQNYTRTANNAPEPGRNFKATVRYTRKW